MNLREDKSCGFKMYTKVQRDTGKFTANLETEF